MDIPSTVSPTPAHAGAPPDAEGPARSLPALDRPIAAAATATSERAPANTVRSTKPGKATKRRAKRAAVASSGRVKPLESKVSEVASPSLSEDDQFFCDTAVRTLSALRTDIDAAADLTEQSVTKCAVMIAIYARLVESNGALLTGLHERWPLSNADGARPKAPTEADAKTPYVFLSNLILPGATHKSRRTPVRHAAEAAYAFLRQQGVPREALLLADLELQDRLAKHIEGQGGVTGIYNQYRALKRKAAGLTPLVGSIAVRGVGRKVLEERLAAGQPSVMLVFQDEGGSQRSVVQGDGVLTVRPASGGNLKALAKEFKVRLTSHADTIEVPASIRVLAALAEGRLILCTRPGGERPAA